MRKAATIALVCLGLSLPETSSRGQSPRSDIPAAELSSYLLVRPAFRRNCFRCHSAHGEEARRKTLDQLDMTRYPFEGRRGPVAGQAIRKAVSGNASQRTMPKDDPSSLNLEDLTAILKWSDAFDVARARRNNGTAP